MTNRANRQERRGRRRIPTATLAAAALLTLVSTGGACGGEEEGRRDGGSPSPTASPSAPARSPFTGEEGRQGRVLAVKIDNSAVARPSTGVSAADLVYVEQVEGGLSRLMAVYAGQLPKRSGPVRSARESDLELLRQFGHPALAYSGVRSALRERLRKAPLATVPSDAFVRSGSRAVPHNLYVRPKAALRAASKAGKPRDIGFRFAGSAPKGGKNDGQHTVRYPAARFTFDWSAGQERWLVSMDGAPARDTGGKRLGPPTVVVQYVAMPPSRYSDVSGAVTPYIKTVGSGRATVLRDGKAYDVRWKRPGARDGTTFTLPGGKRMPFDRGQVWIVYAER